MIPIDGELALAARTRAQILKSLGAVRDSSQSFMSWSNPSANSLTASRLRVILDQLEAGLLSLGALRVTIHGPCGCEHHEEAALANYSGHAGYWRFALEDGRADFDLVEDKAIVVNGRDMVTSMGDALSLQQSSKMPCPCQPEVKANDHAVSKYFIWPVNADSRLGDLAIVSLTIRGAIQNSGLHRPRSAAREELLKAIMMLDCLILDQSVEEVLAESGMASN